MKLHHKIFGTAMIAAAAVVSCTDLSDLEQRVGSLENRIAAIETQLEGLNGNIEALSTFAENNKTISNVAYDETSNEWTLTLSDNTTITLDQGSEGNTPVVSLDEDRYWMVDYNDGNGPQYLLVGGEKVQAGTNPVFGVDDNGYWTVSYGGETPVQVTDSEGNPVSALGEGSTGSFFSEVTYNEAEGTFTVTLASDGQSYTLPVVAGFICAIDDVDYDVTELFEYGDSRTYQMTVSGVSEMMTFSPDGWTAIVNEADGAYSLVVTAPAQTRAIIADSRTDVTVLAMSASGFATMAKIQVELTDAPIAATATVRAVSGTETENSLTYTVSPDTRTTSWSYIHQLASAEAPTAESEGWTAGSSTTLTIEGLEDNTAYTLYVLPYRNDTPGEIASATATTVKAPINDYYQAYLDGEDIEIGGKIYNISTDGEATLYESGATISATPSTKINFIEDNVSISNFSVSNHIFIGRQASTRSKVQFTNWTRLAPTDGNDAFVLFNLEVSHNNYSTAAYYSAISTNGTFDYVCIDNCKFDVTKNILGVNADDRLLSDVVIMNSDFAISEGTTQTYIIGTRTYTDTESINSVTISNNLFYSTENGNSNFKLFGLQNTDLAALTMNNNTFCNLEGASGTDFYVNVNSIATLNAQYNIFYNTVITHGKNYSAVRCAAANSSGYPTAGSVTNNIAYSAATYTADFFYSTSYSGTMSNTEKLSESPFSEANFTDGVFTTTATYAQYGAQRD